MDSKCVQRSQCSPVKYSSGACVGQLGTRWAQTRYQTKHRSAQEAKKTFMETGFSHHLEIVRRDGRDPWYIPLDNIWWTREDYDCRKNDVSNAWRLYLEFGMHANVALCRQPADILTMFIEEAEGKDVQDEGSSRAVRQVRRRVDRWNARWERNGCPFRGMAASRCVVCAGTGASKVEYTKPSRW